MKSNEEEYKELFLAEALENLEELNKHFVVLEKESGNQKAINAIFRITHTLKGNAMGMGFDAVAELAHVMEDVMGAIKTGAIKLNSELFESLFKANDKLSALIKALETNEKVSYLGIKTKLEIMLKNDLEAAGSSSETTTESETNTDVKQERLQQSDSEAEDEGNDSVQSDDTVTFSDFIQIPVKKLDELMNLTGQLIVERDRLSLVHSQEGKRNTEFEGLNRISSALQYAIMKARMVPVGFLFQKFHRITRDAANIEQKKVDLQLKGTDVEIDRNILKIMSDSLIHLIRNAVSHGVEVPSVRKERNKPERGNITLSAHYEKDNVVITITDDGNGIHADKIRKKIVEKGLVKPEVAQTLSSEEVINYIFEAGFSNAEKVTELSGRGVGMDVVKRSVESIGGHVYIKTIPFEGSSFIITLPSSLALKSVLLFELSNQEYAVPLSYTQAVISVAKKDIHKISQGLMATYLEHTVPVIFLKDIISVGHMRELNQVGTFHKTFDEVPEEDMLDMIIVSYGGKYSAIVIDKLLQQKEVIEKPLPRPLENVKLLSGATLLGNGNICLVLDIAGLMEMLVRYKTAK